MMKTYSSQVYLMKGRKKFGGRIYSSQSLANYYAAGNYHASGIGSFFTHIFSKALPFIKGALKLGVRAAKSDTGRAIQKQIRKHATTAAVNVVGDALEGKNVLQSSKRHVQKATKKLTQKLTKNLK